MKTIAVIVASLALVGCASVPGEGLQLLTSEDGFFQHVLKPYLSMGRIGPLNVKVVPTRTVPTIPNWILSPLEADVRCLCSYMIEGPSAG